MNLNKFETKLNTDNYMKDDVRELLNYAFKLVEENERMIAEFTVDNKPEPIEEWHEDMGDCLFWKYPVEEPPYCGTPLDIGFIEEYYTHFTRLLIPKEFEC
ncbi:MAG: hypothetical protein ACRCVJ_11855 [Clostridium sp.]|uniref:hypothetical protein n=1 Tax=Clostridium sp. TaxID=1506 RepID=UPI003F35A76E